MITVNDYKKFYTSVIRLGNIESLAHNPGYYNQTKEKIRPAQYQFYVEKMPEGEHIAAMFTDASDYNDSLNHWPGKVYFYGTWMEDPVLVDDERYNDWQAWGSVMYNPKNLIYLGNGEFWMSYAGMNEELELAPFTAKSTDWGVTWDVIQLADWSGDSSIEQMRIGGHPESDLIHFVFEDWRVYDPDEPNDERGLIRHITYNKSTEQVNVSDKLIHPGRVGAPNTGTLSTNAGDAQIYVDNSGVAHIFWSESLDPWAKQDPLDVRNINEIWYTTNTNGSWGSITKISNTNPEEAYEGGPQYRLHRWSSRIHRDDSGDFHVISETSLFGTNSRFAIWYAKQVNGVWQEEVNVYPGQAPYYTEDSGIVNARFNFKPNGNPIIMTSQYPPEGADVIVYTEFENEGWSELKKAFLQPYENTETDSDAWIEEGSYELLLINGKLQFPHAHVSGSHVDYDLIANSIKNAEWSSPEILTEWPERTRVPPAIVWFAGASYVAVRDYG